MFGGVNNGNSNGLAAGAVVVIGEYSARRPKIGRRGKGWHQREEDAERNGEEERVLSIGKH